MSIASAAAHVWSFDQPMSPGQIKFEEKSLEVRAATYFWNIEQTQSYETKEEAEAVLTEGWTDLEQAALTRDKAERSKDKPMVRLLKNDPLSFVTKGTNESEGGRTAFYQLTCGVAATHSKATATAWTILDNSAEATAIMKCLVRDEKKTVVSEKEASVDLRPLTEEEKGIVDLAAVISITDELKLQTVTEKKMVQLCQNLLDPLKMIFFTDTSAVLMEGSSECKWNVKESSSKIIRDRLIAKIVLHKADVDYLLAHQEIDGKGSCSDKPIVTIDTPLPLPSGTCIAVFTRGRKIGLDGIVWSHELIAFCEQTLRGSTHKNIKRSSPWADGPANSKVLAVHAPLLDEEESKLRKSQIEAVEEAGRLELLSRLPFEQEHRVKSSKSRKNKKGKRMRRPKSAAAAATKRLHRRRQK